MPTAAVAGSVVWGADVRDSVVGYLSAYAAMNLGAFAVVAVASRRLGAVAISDYRGLAWRSPWLGVALAFFLASLAGLPPGLIGLLVKVRVLIVPVDSGQGWLAAVMAVATVIGLIYYLTWAAQLFRRPEPEPEPDAVDVAPARVVLASGTSAVAVGICLVVTVVFSVAPSLALGLVDRL